MVDIKILIVFYIRPLPTSIPMNVPNNSYRTSPPLGGLDAPQITNAFNFNAEEQALVLSQFVSHQKDILTNIVKLGYPILRYLEDVIQGKKTDDSAINVNTSKDRKISSAKRVSTLNQIEAINHKVIIESIRDCGQLNADTLDFALSTFMAYDYSLICRITSYVDGSEKAWYVGTREAEHIIAQKNSWLKVGQDFVELLVKSNMGLVYKATHKFRGEKYNLPDDDIITAGISGLTRSIYRWPENPKGAFSTRAYNWIEALAQRYVQTHARTIRLPTHLYERYFRIRKAIKDLGGDDFLSSHGSSEKLAQHTGLSPETITQTLECFSTETASFNATYNQSTSDGEGFTLEDITPDKSPTPGNQLLAGKINDELEEILTGLALADEIKHATVALSYNLDQVDDVCESLTGSLADNIKGSFSRLLESCPTISKQTRHVKMA